MTKKILIIEDESDLSKVIRKRLVDAGFLVEVASDAYQGISASQKFRPDLIVLDLGIPAGGGVGFLDTMQKSTIIKFIPVIVLTAQRDEQIKAEVLKREVAAYMEKPYEPEKLLETINRILVL